MSLLGEVEGNSWISSYSTSPTKLSISIQPTIHPLTVVAGKLSGGLTIYICYMVFTIIFFNFSFVSKSIINLFFLGSWSLNTCSSLALLWVVTWMSPMLTELEVTFTSTIGLVSIILLPLFFKMFYILPNLGQFINLCPTIPQMWQG